MEEKRKEIIIEEIIKWRESQLLPKTYCDFLLGLYTEGDSRKEEMQPVKTSPLTVLKQTGLIFAILFGFIISPILILYFTQVSPPMQLAVLGSIFFLSGGAGWFYRNRNPLCMHIYILLATFISFILLVVTAEMFFEGGRTFIGAGMISLCLIWGFSGKLLKIPYLYIAGGTGIVLLLGFLLAEQI